MKKRNLLAVFALPFVTFGIYSIVWLVKTKGEMNRLGAKIPTAWLLVIPIVNFYWFWEYSEGVEQITNEKLTTPLAFILEILLGPIGSTIIQNYFNKLGDMPVSAPEFVAPPTMAEEMPEVSEVPEMVSQSTSIPSISSEYTSTTTVETMSTSQVNNAPTGVIADVVPQPTTNVAPENNSPSSPISPNQE